MLVEVLPKVEHSYSGKMKLIGFCKPRWFDGNDRHTKWNPDVVHEDLPIMANAQSWKIFAKRLINFYLWLNGKLREKLPSPSRQAMMENALVAPFRRLIISWVAPDLCDPAVSQTRTCQISGSVNISKPSAATMRFGPSANLAKRDRLSADAAGDGRRAGRRFSANITC